jgi:hypothetical protein
MQVTKSERLTRRLLFDGIEPWDPSIPDCDTKDSRWMEIKSLLEPMSFSKPNKQQLLDMDPEHLKSYFPKEHGDTKAKDMARSRLMLRAGSELDYRRARLLL